MTDVFLDNLKKSYGYFTFIIAWNEYLLTSALSDRDTKTVLILIVNNMFEFNVEWGVIMATGMLLAIPPTIFTLFASRQIITGMTAGAVKVKTYKVQQL